MGKMLLLWRRGIPAFAMLTLLPLLLVSCAKRPVTTAGVPAPTAAAATAPTSPGAPSPGSAPVSPSSRMAAPTPGGAAPALAQRAPAPAPKEFTAIKDLKPIHFDFDKYDIRPGDAKILDENAKWMKANPNYLVLIEGHCDERGTNEYNLALGERRAKATMNYLVAQGIAAARLTILSYGEERPFCTEKNEECWAKNRRADFLVKPM